MTKIHNCHSHIFTLNNVPNNFIVLPLRFLAKYKLTRTLTDFLHKLLPFNRNDLLDRYANFVIHGDQSKQIDVLEELLKYYPSDAVFVILSMDMDYMGAGAAKCDFINQIEELAEIKANPKYKDRIIPFICADPRRKNLLNIVKDAIENKGFGGIKLYPALGFYPFDERLYPIYEYAVAKNLPITTHCTKGGVYYKGEIPDSWLIHPKTNQVIYRTSNKDFAQNFTNPDNYKYVLDIFPELKLCFAHFGGADEWELYRDSIDKEDYSRSWLYKIKELIINPSYKNLFTDIAYTISTVGKSSEIIDPNLLDVLNVFLTDPILNKRILFGSDYYMASIEGSEYKFSTRLRRELEEENYKQIAEINPQQFLY